jgi:integrase
MALFKRTFTKIDPKTGQKIINPKTGKPKQFLTDKWYGQYRDLGGRVHRVPLATDKVAAQQMLADLVKQSERGLAGVSDPFAKHTFRPLSEHIDDFEKSIASGDITEKHAALTARRVRALVAGCEFRFIADINVDRVARWLAERRATSKRFGLTTSNHYSTALTTFCNWLSDKRRGNRCAVNPYSKVPALNAETDVRRQRRALTDEEIAWLLESTEAGPVIGDVSGEDRAMVYRVGVMTGLRAGELRSLTPLSFDLAGDPPTLTVEARHSKHRKEDQLPLHPELAARLRVWFSKRAEVQADSPAILSLKGTPAGRVERLWDGAAWKSHRSAKTLRRDLKAARERWIEAAADDTERKAREASECLLYRTREGYADFHSLRHTFITRIMDSGVVPHHGQGLARHANIKQTLKYTHTRMSGLSQSLRQVPSLPSTTKASTSVAVG